MKYYQEHCHRDGENDSKVLEIELGYTQNSTASGFLAWYTVPFQHLATNSIRPSYRFPIVKTSCLKVPIRRMIKDSALLNSIF